MTTPALAAPRGTRRSARRIAMAALAAVLVAGVVALARTRADGPARCAEGMAPIGARCCGEGQRLEAGRCAGRPDRCARGLSVTNAGCVPAPRIADVAAGTLHALPGDWEAEGVVGPREIAIASFRIDAHEVTEERYRACAAEGACRPIPSGGEPGLPVVGITRDEAAGFCSWANGSLPSPDQLAFAAAGPEGRRYAWGDTGAVCRRAAWGLRSGPCAYAAVGPDLVGAHPDGATPGGIFDLAGNVAEWTTTTGADSDLAEVRGGSWADGAASALRAWSRRELRADSRSSEIGFRCVYPSN
jgi:formylglycine-generating enzyme required for sulfatase activity